MSWLIGCVAPLTTKCSPPPPASQKWYWVIASPSGSLAVNSVEAAKLCPRLAVMLALVGVTAGGVSTGDAGSDADGSPAVAVGAETEVGRGIGASKIECCNNGSAIL